MKALRGPRLVASVLVFLLHVPTFVSSQQAPNVPEKYKRLFVHYSDQRKWYEKALNSVGLTSVPVGKSFALIAGVTQFPNFPPVDQSLRPAQVDIEKLKSYLKDQEFFDEIVVLKDGDMTLDNLNYFLNNYFPKRAAASPHSRFLFAYSGHGYADKDSETVRGFLLTSSAISLTDPENRIELSVVRTMLEPVVDSAEKVLVLINACQSGAFLGRKSFGPNPLGPGDRGAHAIMASRANQRSFQLDNVGPGSVFFEKIFAGLGGVADNSPRDGVVTYHELDTYLRSEVPYVTNGSQIPDEGDISRNGSIGEFFFLNRSRQVTLGNNEAWNPGNAKTFGVAASDQLELGRKAYLAEEYDNAFPALTAAASAGNTEAMVLVGYMHSEAQGVKRDYAQARQWYERAAAAGDAWAMYNLAYLYENGYGVRQDYSQARLWDERAAATGHAGAMRALGYFYYNGYGVKQDYAEARQWFEKAAMAGDSSAMRNLGIFYENGKGVERDYSLARQWYGKAAAAGDDWAMTGLGQLYEIGKGVAQDYAQARQWYAKAAAVGNAGAMYSLGRLYDLGTGVEQDYAQARQWYEKAAAAGYKDAEERLKTLPR